MHKVKTLVSFRVKGEANVKKFEGTFPAVEGTDLAHSALDFFFSRRFVKDENEKVGYLTGLVERAQVDSVEVISSEEMK